MEEIWKEIEGWPNYYVSSLGKVKRFERILKPNLNTRYLKVKLYRKNGKKIKDCKVHRLVGKAFVPNPLNKPHIDHLNSNKLDNRAINLEWVTNLENQQRSWLKTNRSSAKGESHGCAKLKLEQVKEIRRLINTKQFTHQEIANQFHVSKSLITYIKSKGWK